MSFFGLIYNFYLLRQALCIALICAEGRGIRFANIAIKIKDLTIKY